MQEEIKSILGSKLKVKDKMIPVEHMRYTGKEKTYITWTLLDERPSFFANDEILYSICPLDIDIFSESNYLDILLEIKKIMLAKEWIWTCDSEEMFSEETGLYYRTCSFEKERVIDNG